MIKAASILLLVIVLTNCSDGTEPKVEDGHSVTINNFQKITDDGYHPRWSPDGSMIVYTIWNISSNKVELWIWEKSSNSRHSVVQNMDGDLTPNWSPDSKKIIFDGYDNNGISQIWTIELSTGISTKLTSFVTAAFQPSYSHDDSKIAFQYSGAIYIKDLSSGAQQKIPGTEKSGSPEWSIDDSKIIYSYDPAQNNISDIFMINVDGSQKRQLTNFSGRDSRPRLSPDGKVILFERFSNDKVHPAFYFIEDDETIVVEDITDCNMPDISPDGKQIVFAMRNGIFIADLLIK
ncbi:MAG: hypothetical protein V1720_11520 [bacterium]